MESVTTPDPSITELLLSTAKRYPQVFFKPLFLCAASNKELIIANHLRVLITLSTYLPNILTSNAEMMSVALMGNLSNTGGIDETSNPTWEQARLGHCIVMVELINRLKTVRKSAVGFLGSSLERSKLSDLAARRARKSRCVRYLTGISASRPVGSKGMFRAGYQSINADSSTSSTGKEYSCPVFPARALLHAFLRDEIDHAVVKTVGCASLSRISPANFPLQEPVGQSGFTVGHAMARRIRGEHFHPGRGRANGVQVARPLFHRGAGFST